MLNLDYKYDDKTNIIFFMNYAVLSKTITIILKNPYLV